MPDLTLWTAREILRMKRDLDTLFSSLCEDFGTCGLPDALAGPSIDIVQEEDALVISAELPGVNPQDLRVAVQDDRLLLAHEQRSVMGESGATIESRSHFSHTIRLPCRVDADKADAIFENQTLTITLPRCEPSRPKPLSIRIG
ncbi:Hsp20/alpha crystallin family protein [Desulfocurvibacter africanus]|uniref:Hsp20/alpha crystallin family protein n=1 Tax=Desulfocurvibacter africanus TaxID=873 RepID=UPI00040DB20F|nr:Hsp20/alpha crystallin family protein [Desulfocurvibacter africanus]